MNSLCMFNLRLVPVVFYRNITLMFIDMMQKQLFTGILQNRLQAFILTESNLSQVLSCEFYKVFQNTYFTEHLRVTASDYRQEKTNFILEKLLFNTLKERTLTKIEIDRLQTLESNKKVTNNKDSSKSRARSGASSLVMRLTNVPSFSIVHSFLILIKTPVFFKRLFI